VASGSVETPLPDDEDKSFDFGFQVPLAVGDRVWRDDGNGRQDAGEPGIAGVAVQLWSRDGRDRLVATTTTDLAGFYRFAAPVLASGRWKLVVDPTQAILRDMSPSPTEASTASERTDSNGDVRGEAEFEISRPHRFGTDLSFDFGFVAPCEILTGTIFVDDNRNELRDGRESAVVGATVQLRDGARVVASTATDAAGSYRFRVVAAATAAYSITLDLATVRPIALRLPAGFSDGANNSTSTCCCSCCTGAARLLRNVGLVRQPAVPSLGDFVFLDRNGNGRQDATDTPLSGVEVCLYRASSLGGGAGASPAKERCTKTAADGSYLFNDGVAPLTDYVVAIDLAQALVAQRGLYPTFANEPGVADALDSDGEVLVIDGRAHTAVGARSGSGASANLTLDFGLYSCVETDVRTGLPDARVVFTGDTAGDFRARANAGAWQYFADNDEAPDVGLPRIYYSADRISGWDMRGIYYAYSPTRDTLYFGVDCFGICGDADGNGDPATIDQAGAIDHPNLESSETFAIKMDTNSDGVFDVIVGKPGKGACTNIDCLGAYLYDATLGFNPGDQFAGARLALPVRLHCNPSLACPDLEFTVARWSEVPGLQAEPFEWKFSFEAFAGSYHDGGIGEDAFGVVVPLRARFICPAFAYSAKFNPLIAPVLGSCCEATRSSQVGCVSLSVQQCVCRSLPQCCETAWSAECVAAVDRNGCAGEENEFTCELE
jgi:hypothetical protein